MLTSQIPMFEEPAAFLGGYQMHLHGTTKVKKRLVCRFSEFSNDCYSVGVKLRNVIISDKKCCVRLISNKEESVYLAVSFLETKNRTFLSLSVVFD